MGVLRSVGEAGGGVEPGVHGIAEDPHGVVEGGAGVELDHVAALFDRLGVALDRDPHRGRGRLRGQAVDGEVAGDVLSSAIVHK
uniref:hypothetical protein n=1 Tax=Brucella cytisi TaxID=407152 RepID=UPI0035DF5023